jgi:hypothetical protein
MEEEHPQPLIEIEPDKTNGVYSLGRGPWRFPAVLLIIFAEYFFSELIFTVNEWGCHTINREAYGYNPDRTLMENYGLYQVRILPFFI